MYQVKIEREYDEIDDYSRKIRIENFVNAVMRSEPGYIKCRYEIERNNVIMYYE